jgi:hypothetical protein
MLLSQVERDLPEHRQPILDFMKQNYDVVREVRWRGGVPWLLLLKRKP